MRISLQPAFVLHSRPYRDTSLIIDLFLQDLGRTAVVARGARSSRLRAVLQLFSPLVVSCQGKTELLTLTAAEPQGAPLRLSGNHLLSGFYLNELLVRLLHKHDPHPQLYAIYAGTLLDLQQAHDQQKTLRLFEKKLLEELGYGLQLQQDIPNGRPIMPDCFYDFVPEYGFKLTIESSNAFAGSSLLALAAEELTTLQSLQDAKRLMRLALAPLLGTEPLQSRKLFYEVK